jgi:hypothetical protein
MELAALRDGSLILPLFVAEIDIRAVHNLGFRDNLKSDHTETGRRASWMSQLFIDDLTVVRDGSYCSSGHASLLSVMDRTAHLSSGHASLLSVMDRTAHLSSGHASLLSEMDRAALHRRG